MTHEELQYRAGFDLASFFAALDSFTEAMEYLRKYDRKKAVRKAAIDLMSARVAEIGGYALSRLENEKDDKDSFRESFLDSAQFTARNLLHQYAKISAYPASPPAKSWEKLLSAIGCAVVCGRSIVSTKTGSNPDGISSWWLAAAALRQVLRSSRTAICPLPERLVSSNEEDSAFSH